MVTDMFIEVLDSCIACGKCVDICPRYLFCIKDKRAEITDFESCNDCGHCVAICPVDAIDHKRLIITSLDQDFPKIRKEIRDYDETLAFMRQRRSIRLFDKKTVSTEKLESLIDLGRYAPTGHNARKVSYTIVNTREEVEIILNEMIDFFKDLQKKVKSPIWKWLAYLTGKSKSYKKVKQNMYRINSHVSHWDRGIDKVFHNASTLILIHVSNDTATPVEDCSIASQNILLGAPSLDLGGTFVGYLVYSWKGSVNIRKLLNLPKDHGLYACIAIGFPKHKFKRYVPRPLPFKSNWSHTK